MSAAPSKTRVKLFVVEDDPVYRHFLREVLRKMELVELVGEAPTGKEGIALCLAKKPDVLLLDLMLPDMQGIEVINQIRPSLPSLHVMLLTAQPRKDLPAELMRLSVAGFLDKSATVLEITGGIRKLLAGGLVYSSSAGLGKTEVSAPTALTGMAVNFTPDVLTAREREIARLVAGAMSSKEVAAELGLSPRTVEKHRANIYDKLRLRDVVGLTRWCLHHKLVR
jgi:DNA-binding NarL/FixJ family response regulator